MKESDDELVKQVIKELRSTDPVNLEESCRGSEPKEDECFKGPVVSQDRFMQTPLRDLQRPKGLAELFD